MSLDMIPCISGHKHLFSAHQVCQWCHKDREKIELQFYRKLFGPIEAAVKKAEGRHEHGAAD